jgi:hypothetical protein
MQEQQVLKALLVLKAHKARKAMMEQQVRKALLALLVVQTQIMYSKMMERMQHAADFMMTEILQE